VAFLDRKHVAVVEDAGDLLHTQRNALDSGYSFDGRHNYRDGAQPVRFLGPGPRTQHGDNVTWQIVGRTGGGNRSGDWAPENDAPEAIVVPPLA
jgi:hypothetical protein